VRNRFGAFHSPRFSTFCGLIADSKKKGFDQKRPKPLKTLTPEEGFEPPTEWFQPLGFISPSEVSV